MTHKNIGSSFDDFLEEEGLLEEATVHAIKRVLAWQIQQAMERDRLSKSAMALRMRTSRAQLDRLLDPNNVNVQLGTLQRAAEALGRKLVVELR